MLSDFGSQTGAGICPLALKEDTGMEIADLQAASQVVREFITQLEQARRAWTQRHTVLVRVLGHRGSHMDQHVDVDEQVFSWEHGGRPLRQGI
jgi:hypothetical protein